MNLHLKYKLHGYESMSDLLRFLFQFTMIGISLYQLSAPFYGKSLANYLDLEGYCLGLRGYLLSWSHFHPCTLVTEVHQNSCGDV
jgi:hypothetical protein